MGLRCGPAEGSSRPREDALKTLSDPLRIVRHMVEKFLAHLGKKPKVSGPGDRRFLALAQSLRPVYFPGTGIEGRIILLKGATRVPDEQAGAHCFTR